MSLPLPYRPKGVIEYIEEEQKEHKTRHDTTMVDKKIAFLDSMIKWYRNLSKKNKSALTKKNLRRKSYSVAFKVKLPYMQIPQDYMTTMVKECGLVCYISQRALARRDVREQKAYKRTITGEEESSSEEEGSKVANGDQEKKVKYKEFIDLTSSSGSGDGTLAGFRTGPMRMQVIASLADKNVAYWDYDISHWKVEGGLDLTKLQDSKGSPERDVPASEYNSWEN